MSHRSYSSCGYLWQRHPVALVETSRIRLASSDLTRALLFAYGAPNAKGDKLAAPLGSDDANASRGVAHYPAHLNPHSRVPTSTLIGRFSSIRRACSNDTVRSSRSSTHV